MRLVQSLFFRFNGHAISAGKLYQLMSCESILSIIYRFYWKEEPWTIIPHRRRQQDAGTAPKNDEVHCVPLLLLALLLLQWSLPSPTAYWELQSGRQERWSIGHRMEKKMDSPEMQNVVHSTSNTITWLLSLIVQVLRKTPPPSPL